MNKVADAKTLGEKVNGMDVRAQNPELFTFRKVTFGEQNKAD